MPVLVFISGCLIFGCLYLVALQIGFLFGKRKYDPLKGKDPDKMTVSEIYDTMTDPQKIVCSYFVGEALQNRPVFKKNDDVLQPKPTCGMGWDKMKVNRLNDYYEDDLK